MQKDLGGLPPEQALDYMEKTPDLVIVNVAGRGFWDRNHFDGAVNIPTEDIGDDASIEKLKELPAGRPRHHALPPRPHGGRLVPEIEGAAP